MSIAEENVKVPVLDVLPAALEGDFQTAEVVTVAAAHGAHDTYFSYLPTILPLLIHNLSLSTAQAGLLSACSAVPEPAAAGDRLPGRPAQLEDTRDPGANTLRRPDHHGRRGTQFWHYRAAVGAGRVAARPGFHAIAPAMVGARWAKSGSWDGVFMVGGELGFGLGPLVVVAATSLLTLKGLPWLMTLGILASVVLFIR